MRYWLLIISIILAGCAGPHSGPTPYRSQAHSQDSVPLSPSQNRIRQLLQSQYQQWQGVPYRLGGTSRAGVDCSGFTQLTFRDRFNLNLPRTTGAQARQGVPVTHATLEPGDLLFFKTASKVRHVGIYMGRGEFLHASTSRGVMISRLSNPYWQRHYWQARRL